ncbi:MAG: serine/threonine-protein kinase [Chlamydiales bacterium]|nr:serine/threonine-protein kinase [Chlamydiales bacterium]
MDQLYTNSDLIGYYYGIDGCLYPAPPIQSRVFYPMPVPVMPVGPRSWQGVAMPLARHAVTLPRPASGPMRLTSQADSYPFVPVVGGGIVMYPYHAWIGGRFLVNRTAPMLGISNLSILLSAQDVTTGREVALKVNRHPRHSDSILHEGDVMRDIQSSEIISMCFIPQYLGHFELGPDDEISDQYLPYAGECNKHSCLVMEKMGADLHDHRQSIMRDFTFKEIQTFARDMLNALTILERHGVIHGDFKLENLLLTADSQHVKLCDFGLADRPPYHKHLIQSTPYRSPEVLLGMARSTKIDIWSFGCTVFELWGGSRLFNSKNDFDLMTEMVDMLGVPSRRVLNGCDGALRERYFHKFPNGSYSFVKPLHRNPLESRIDSIFATRVLKASPTTEAITEVLRAALVVDPSQRLSASQILELPFFRMSFV